VAREPLSPHLRSWHAFFYLLSTGRLDEARKQSERVLEDDPLCQMWYFCHAFLLQALRLDDDALAAMRRAVELDPQFWVGQVQLALLHALGGRHAEALACAEEAYACAPWSALAIGMTAGTLENAGQSGRAQRVRDTLEGRPHAPWGHAYDALCRGEFERAAEWTMMLADERAFGFVPLLVRGFEPFLRQSAAFPALLKKLDLARADLPSASAASG
jgi:tetratricopeptide (TPR) repeat protein